MGRPKGSQNKVTLNVKAALLECYEQRGGIDALLKWSNKNPDAFYQLWGRLAPREVHGELTGPGGGPIQVMMIGGKKVKF